MSQESEGQELETTGRTVVRIFRGRAEAEAAIRDLGAAGFTDDQIDVATPPDEGSTAVLLTISAGNRTEEALRILERHSPMVRTGPFRAVVDRRLHRDPSYAGPERRLAGV
jgi:hypothetical protein